ncbi:carboxypeptidase [Xylogone sp. PMI_703]|nr:carboxypeptidase [Xylogone sp. PMI_703]
MEEKAKTRAELRRRQFSKPRGMAALLVLLACVACLTMGIHICSWRTPSVLARPQAVCVQPDALFPSADKDGALDKAYEYLSSGAFRNATIERLGGAVRIPTQTFDDLGDVDEDPRWDVFFDFHAYLEQTFPRLHRKLQVEKVNTHGLLYTWQGSDKGLKPTLLMAHQDTVPVPAETIDDWAYPPWSGAYDGKFIWGRGSSDCKNQLIGILEAAEGLLDAGFQPRRTILLSFGYDEETFGYHGAGNLSAVIQKRYGDNSLAVIIDEGSGFEQAWGTLFAKPGTAEKGSTNVEIIVRTPGGHSSIPRDHTSIGILSEIITKIEATQYPTRLDERNPYFTQLQCGATYAPEFPSNLKKLLAHHSQHAEPDRLAIEAAKQGPEIKYLMQTSQAVDIIAGGAKVNAMPERASAVVNHRVNVGETTQSVYDRLTVIADQIADKYDLKLHAFDGKEEPQSITLIAPRGLEAAPISPADGSIISPFSILAGSVRALYGKETVVTPGIMTGNTDTRFFWDLTRHIFRFEPGYDPEDDSGVGNIHTINEKVNVNSHINLVKFFTLFLRNIDEAEI